MNISCTEHVGISSPLHVEEESDVRFSSARLIKLLEAHIAEVRDKFPDDPPYEGYPDYEEDS